MKLRQAILVLILIAVGVVGLKVLTASKPEIQKQKKEVPAPMVRVVTVSLGPEMVRVIGEGTVYPLREINLAPQVSGKIVEVSPALVAGGAFKKGDLLLRIDPVDYELALASVTAQLRDAESNLKQAVEESAVSKEEWRVHRNREGPVPPLVAKEPQLAAARAKVAAYQAELKQAQISLERTRILAPFDGRVSQKEADLGQYVAPGQTLAEIFATEAAEIVVPLEDRDLFWIHVPGFSPRGRTGFQGRGPGPVRGTAHELDRARGAGRRQIGRKYPDGQRGGSSGRTVRHQTALGRGALRDRGYRGADLEEWRGDSPSGPEGGQSGLGGQVSGQGRLGQAGVSNHHRGPQPRRSCGGFLGLEDGEQVVVTTLKVVTNGMTVRTAAFEDDRP